MKNTDELTCLLMQLPEEKLVNILSLWLFLFLSFYQNRTSLHKMWFRSCSVSDLWSLRILIQWQNLSVWGWRRLSEVGPQSFPVHQCCSCPELTLSPSTVCLWSWRQRAAPHIIHPPSFTLSSSFTEIVCLIFSHTGSVLGILGHQSVGWSVGRQADFLTIWEACGNVSCFQ